jgi:elongation factor G
MIIVSVPLILREGSMMKINVALAGHTSVGKTSFLDTLLWNIGAADTLGKVDDGKSLSDYNDEEIRRKISIKSAAFSVDYNDARITLVDTPGSSDFAGEVVSAFYGVDSVILLIDAVNGVEIETSKIWARCKSMGLPVILFVNKIDKERSDFNGVLTNIRENLGAQLFPVHLPVGAEGGFKGIVDLIRMKAFLYEGDQKKGKEQDIPPEVKDQADAIRGDLIETAAESTDELTEKYLEGEQLTEQEILQGLKEMVVGGKALPVLCGSCSLNRGVTEAMDIVSLLAPPSNFREKITVLDAADTSKEIEIARSADSSFTGLVFKTIVDQFAGKISLLKVLTGTVHPEEEVYNTTVDKKEKLSKLALPFGKTQRPLKGDATEGDIVVLTKLPYAETGHTLCSSDRLVVLPEMKLPSPVYGVAIKAKNKKEEDKLNAALQRGAEEDISFHVDYNKETKQTVISGMGELQFNIVLSRIKEKQGIEFETSTPLVAYRETIQTPAKGNYKHKKQSGGHGQYGEVHLEVEPLERGTGFEFVDKIVGGVIPKGYIPGVEKGVVEAMEEGVVAGYPVVDVRVNLVFGSYHDVDSSELSFKIAGRQAFKIAMEQAKPTILEPVMDLSVYVSEQYTGDIMSDLNSKRGRVLGMDNIGGGIQKIRAKVPQAELLKYSIELRSITSGTGSFEMDFSHYDPISGKIADDVIAETAQRKEEDAKEK